MVPRSAAFDVEESGSDHFPNLETVQAAALPLFAGELGRVLQALLESGALVIQDGKIITNPAHERRSE